MSRPAELKENLDYVRSVVEEAERPVGMWKIYLLWALLIPPGFALPDLAPAWAGWYWLVVGPGGGLLSYWIGWSSCRRAGQGSRRIARLQALHWAGVGGAMAAVAVIGGVTGAWDLVAPFFLLVAGLGWFLLGLHWDPAMMVLGVLLGAASVSVALVQGAAWTTAGAGMGVALAVTALRTRQAGPHR